MGLIEVLSLGKWGSQIQPQGARSGVPSIGRSIERQVDALVCHDAVGVNETRLDVLGLEPWMTLKDRLRPISRGEHSEDMFDCKTMTPDDRFPAEDLGVHGDPLKEFVRSKGS